MSELKSPTLEYSSITPSQRREYQEYNILQTYLENGYTSRDIAKVYNVSYKLVNLWLLEYGLISRTSELALP